MLRKRHAELRRVWQLIALAVVLGVGVAHDAIAGRNTSAARGSLVRRESLGLPARRQFIFHTLPPMPTRVGTRQAAGRQPDVNITANAPASAEMDPSASPTDTMNRVAFVSNGVDENRDGRIDATLPTDPNFQPHYHIWIMRPDGSEQIPVTLNVPGDQIEPAYDPGGRLIAYAGKASPTSNWEIYTVEVRSGFQNPVVRVLTDRQPGNKRHPTWSPDGNWIAYQCDAQGNWDIYKMPSTGAGAQVQLTTSPEDDTQPAWQPASNALDPGGNAIAYTTVVGAVTRIYWVHAVTGAIDALTEGGGDALASDADPAWSRDASMLAFASNRLTPGDAIRNYNVFRTGARGEIGTDSTLVSNTDPAEPTDSRYPTWSPALRPYSDPGQTPGQPPIQTPIIRLFYMSDRRPGTGGESRDIWVTAYEDSRPPSLAELPRIEKDPQPQPGGDVVIHATVFDDDSGVQSVFAIIKDPDEKIYLSDVHSNPDFDSGAPGVQELEWDFAQVGTVQLFDDGDPANYDAVANDGIYSGAWTTPVSPTSDYIIDVDVSDNAGNRQIYDNVGGFTTSIFQPRSNVLVVNDYCEGQKFLYQLGYNNDYPSAWNCESFYTRNPGRGPVPPDFDTISDYPRSQGVTENYDLWRVICRGRVPESVYQYYLPTVEYQLDPQEAVTSPETATPKRQVRVAERAVIWACPHAGSIWVGPGTLTDAEVQADITFFLERGGRMMISGSDIAWALTLNGAYTNDFLTNTLHASFVSDGFQLNVTVPRPHPGDPPDNPGFSNIERTDYGFELIGNSGDVVSEDAWAGSGAAHWGGNYAPLQLETPYDRVARAQGSPPPTHGDAHEWSCYPDTIAELGGAVKVYGYRPYDGTQSFADSPTAGLRYEDPQTSAKLIYFAFGFESIHRSYDSDECFNHRSHLMHNILCWMRTGGMQGRVLSISDGMRPITNPNPIVRLWRGVQGPPPVTETPDFAVRCQDDGTYMISGLPPGRYTIEAARPGYETDRFDGYLTHGGWPPYTVDFAVSRAKPGGLAGTVTSAATNAPLAQVEVRAYPVPPPTQTTAAKEGEVNSAQGGGVTQEPDWEQLGSPVGRSTTGANGAYSIGSLPPGEYYVIADGSGIGYGNDWTRVTIAPGNLTTQNFALPAADGIIVALVRRAVDGAPVRNARVEARTASGVVAGSGVTDETGTVRLRIQPGGYETEASAAGYQSSMPQSVVVNSNEERQVTFTLQAEPPGSLTGRIVAATSKAPVGNVLVRLLSNDVVIATTTTSSTLQTPTGGGAAYNYRFDNVPTGSIVVRPAPVGFTATPAERTVTVVSGATTEGVNFELNSLHTFPAGLQLISVPYDYSTISPRELLNVPEPNPLLLATYESSARRYRLFPQAPADALRIGTGYWLRLASAADITLQGPPAPSTTSIPLVEGWNLIGAPFPEVTDFYSVIVEDRAGARKSVQQALSQGLLEGGMFAWVLNGYRSTSVFTPWVGTWLMAGEPVWLHITRRTNSSAVVTDRPMIQMPPGGWLATIEASVGDMVDSATQFGMCKTATAGYDRGLDARKPPAVDFAPSVYAAFVNEEWGPKSGNYAVDVRSAAAQQAVWSLSVWTTVAGADVTLRWPDLSAVPRKWRPVLEDLTTGKRVHMRTATSYTFRAGSEPRRFKITLAGSAAGGLVVSGVSAQRLRGGDCQITYTLSADAQVDVTVVNIGGRTVRHLPTVSARAGTNTVAWDGRSDAGTLAPAGRYLVVLSARSDDGQQTRALTPLSIGR